MDARWQQIEWAATPDAAKPRIGNLDSEQEPIQWKNASNNLQASSD